MSKEQYIELGEAVAVATPVDPPKAKEAVEAVAPAALDEGYHLAVDVNGSTVTVEVPEGGVKEGQRFVGQIVPTKEEGSYIPHGHWRDGLCDCFQKRPCGALNGLAFCCSPIALAQVMTRMKLDWTGGYQGNGSQSSTFKIVVFIFVGSFAIGQLLQLFYWSLLGAEGRGAYMSEGQDVAYYEPTSAVIVKAISHGIQLLVGLYFLIAMIRTRAFIRHKYSIPEQDCAGCEDCCCSYWCHCCALTQMARHTADYDTNPPSCCTEDGLTRRSGGFIV